MKKSVPTKLDFAILGLLSSAPMTGYQIRKIFETSDMGNYSSSPGSIYPALKRLERLGLIHLIPLTQPTGKIKKQFQLTDVGTKALIHWMEEKVALQAVSKGMDELLLKFAFMDILSHKKQIEFLEEIALIIPRKINDLQSYYQNEMKGVPLNGRLAVQHGIKVFQTHKEWVEMALETIKNLEP